jgi:hypothetical protein
MIQPLASRHSLSVGVWLMLFDCLIDNGCCPPCCPAFSGNLGQLFRLGTLFLRKSEKILYNNYVIILILNRIHYNMVKEYFGHVALQDEL